VQGVDDGQGNEREVRPGCCVGGEYELRRVSTDSGGEGENEKGVREGRARLWEGEERNSASNL
jgi:hypothetical protein